MARGRFGWNWNLVGGGTQFCPAFATCWLPFATLLVLGNPLFSPWNVLFREKIGSRFTCELPEQWLVFAPQGLPRPLARSRAWAGGLYVDSHIQPLNETRLPQFIDSHSFCFALLFARKAMRS